MSITLGHVISDTRTNGFSVVGQVTDASGPGVLTIGSEQMAYQGVSENGFLGLTRGYNSTVAASHNRYDPITFVPNPATPSPTLGMTTSQRNNLTPARGMVVNNTSTNALNYYNGSTWLAVTAS